MSTLQFVLRFHWNIPVIVKLIMAKTESCYWHYRLSQLGQAHIINIKTNNNVTVIRFDYDILSWLYWKTLEKFLYQLLIDIDCEMINNWNEIWKVKLCCVRSISYLFCRYSRILYRYNWFFRSFHVKLTTVSCCIIMRILSLNIVKNARRGRRWDGSSIKYGS